MDHHPDPDWRFIMTRFTRRTVVAGLAALPVAKAIGPRVTAAQGTPAATGVEIIMLSNSSPHVTVIDAASREVTRTADIPDFTSWTWNDDNNYSDGTLLWLGMRNPDTEDAEVVTLDLDSLELTNRIPVGKDSMSLYIGKVANDGILHVGKMGAGEVVTIDTATFAVLDTWTVPVNGDVVCDADIATLPDGSQRFVYPTRKGETVVSIDAVTGETIVEISNDAGTNPLMLSTDRDGRSWVQESGSKTNAVYDTNLELVGRFPTGDGPIVNTFSPDGAYSYIGHGGDTIVQVIDTATLEEVARVQTGTNPQKIAVHPDGHEIYAILTEEAAVAVIDTASWEVSDRIEVGTEPAGISIRGVQA
jgi:YVTN family beta-propeller protein